MSDNPKVPNQGNQKEEVIAMRYQDTVYSKEWRAAMFAEVSAKAPGLKPSKDARLNEKRAAALAEKLIEVANFDEFDLAVLNLPRNWRDKKSLALHHYSRLVSAVVFRGVGVPADIKTALLAGEVLAVGNLGPKFPLKAIKPLIKIGKKPDVKELVLDNGKFPKVVLIGGMSAKKRTAWVEILSDYNIPFIQSADEMIAKFFDGINVSIEDLSALIRLHYPTASEHDASLLKFVRGYDDVLQVRVIEDKKYANFHEFTINGETLKKYTALSGKLDGMHPYANGTKDDHDGVTATKTFAVLLSYVLQGHGKRGMLGRLAYPTDAWMEKDTGAFFGPRTEAIRRGKVAILSIQATKGFGLHVVNGTGEDRAAVAGELSAKGIPSICHHQMGWLTAGIGAQARGVGLAKRKNKLGNVIDALIMFSKPDKAEKMANRVSLAKPTAYVEGMTQSALKIKLATGEEVALDGIKVSVAYACCGLLVNGSGPAPSRPDFTMTVFCPKQTFKTEIVLGIDSTEADAEKAALEGLQFPESGKCGDALINWHGEKRSTFTLFNGEFTRLDAGKWMWNKETRRLEVSVTISWRYTTQTEKLVADGIKARIAPEAIEIVSGGVAIDQPQVFLTHEELKGTQGLVAMWAESVPGGVVYDPNVGLTPEQQEQFQAWVLKNTKVVTIRRQVNTIHYSNLKTLHGDNPAYVFEDDNFVTWTGEAIFGEVVLAVEYSTTFQAEGTSELFPELLYSLALLNREFEYLWETKGARRRRGSFHGLNHMVQNQHGNSAHEPAVIDLMAPNAVILTAEELKDENGNMVTHGTDYIKALAKKYPVGFYVTFSGMKQFIDPGALEMLSGRAGTLNAVISNTVDLVKYFVLPENRRPGRSMAEQIFSYMRLIRKAATAMLTAGNVLKKPFRTGKMLTRKVAPTCRFGVEAWELHVNPMDPVVLNGTLKADQIVGGNRVPVIFWGAFKVVLDEKTPIGVFEIDAYCWAAINEGDGDGDSIAVLLLPEKVKVGKGDTAREILPQKMLWDACHTVHPGGVTTRLSASGLWVTGPGQVAPLTGGYAVMYGKNFANHPYADFLSEAPKKQIKNLIAGEGGVGIFNAMELPVFADEDLPSEMSYQALTAGILRHYSLFVGASYGVATIALYLLSIAFEKNDTEMFRDLMPVAVFTARFLHEGKHLGGMNSNATRFWNGLKSIIQGGSIIVLDDNGLESRLYGVEAMRYAVETLLGGESIADDGIHLTDSQLLLLRDIRKIALVGNTADREVEDEEMGSEKFMDHTMQEWARVFRLCRLVGKGQITRLNPNEQLSDAAAIRSALEDGQGHALTDRLSIDQIDNVVGGTLLGKVAKAAFNIHSVVVDAVRGQIAEEEAELYS